MHFKMVRTSLQKVIFSVGGTMRRRTIFVQNYQVLQRSLFAVRYGRIFYSNLADFKTQQPMFNQPDKEFSFFFN